MRIDIILFCVPTKEGVWLLDRIVHGGYVVGSAKEKKKAVLKIICNVLPEFRSERHGRGRKAGRRLHCTIGVRSFECRVSRLESRWNFVKAKMNACVCARVCEHFWVLQAAEKKLQHFQKQFSNMYEVVRAWNGGPGLTNSQVLPPVAAPRQKVGQVQFCARRYGACLLGR